MDNKPKLPPGPRPRIKPRVLPPPGDFIALGKSTATKARSNEADSKPSQMPIRKSGMVSSITSVQKRKDINPINPVVAKQARTFSPSFLHNKDMVKTLEMEPMISVKLVDAQPGDLEDQVLLAHTRSDQDQIDGLLCSAIKNLKINRLKPDPMLYLSLMNLSKSNPSIFSSKRIVEHLLQFLRREVTGIAVKPKPNTLLCIMTCNILLHVFQNEETWPQSFMKVYVEDALGDRSWVDNDYNKDFVANITKVFGTVLPVKQTNLPVTKTLDASTGLLNVSLGKSSEEKILKEAGISLEASEPPGIHNRYTLNKDESAIHTYINEVVKEQLNKRQMIDSVSRNILRFLTAVCGYVEVRLLASQRLETWLQNPKLTRPAQELLMSVCMNCTTHSVEDVEVIANIVKMRLKAKPVANQYIQCIKEMISQHPENLGTTLKHVVYNELSQQRNPNNMATLSVIFSNEPESAAKYLSLVFQDLLCNREDYLRAIRALFREIVKYLKYEVNLVEFCRGMMQERKEAVFLGLDQPSKDRMFASVVDLIFLGCFLSISPVVKELAVSLSKGDKRDYSVLQACQTQLSIIQRDAIWFFHTKVMQMYNCSERDFVLGLNRVLFLDTNDQYSLKDNWPPEADRSLLLDISREVPLAEDGLLRLHLLGLSEEIPLNCADALDVIEKLVMRSAILKTGLQGLEIERNEVLNMLLSLSAYSHPRDIMLPAGYTPPPLAIGNLYWKSWLILLILAATNPATIGFKVWETYPTARCLMEMLITGCYEFPPLGIGEVTAQEIQGNDLQIQRAEKDDIIVFEGHLAAATSRAVITESTSLLVSQLISLDPSGSPRHPPKHIIDRLKVLNEKYGLGKMFCRSRDPDFLLSIIQSQGSSRSMPWLADLVQSSESSLSTLPVQCLCEFLLMKHNAPESETHHSKHKSTKPKVAARLQDLLLGRDATAQSSTELISYFIQRWPSSEMRDREAAVDGFQSILLLQKKSRMSISGEEDSHDEMKSIRRPPKVTIVKDHTFSWLHEKLPSLPFFSHAKLIVVTSLRQALHVEVNVPRLQAYILFLTKHHHEFGERFTQMLTEDMSQLLTSRKTISRRLLTNCETYLALLKLYSFAVKSQLKPISEEHQWCNDPDKTVVTWTGNSIHAGNTALFHSRVIHASIILLTHNSNFTEQEDFSFLLQTWFPQNGKVETRLADTGDNCDILQHWLRIFMVQSNIETLVTAGFRGLQIEELISLLQVFGLPLPSLDLLLKLLDLSAVESPDQTLAAVNDKDYIIQLIQLAQSRGACHGKHLCKILQEDEEMVVKSLSVEKIANDLSVIKVDDEPMETVQPKSANILTEEFIQKALLDMFTSDKNKTPSKNFLQLKQRLALACISIQSDDANVTQLVVSVLTDLCDKESFCCNFCTHKSASAILNCVMRDQNTKTESKIMLLKKLAKCATKSSEVDKLVNSACRKYKLLDESENTSSKSTKLDVVLKDFLACKTQVEAIKTGKRMLCKMQEEGIENLPKEKLVKACKTMLSKCRFLCERFIHTFCSGFQSQRSIKRCLEILIEVFATCDEKDLGILIDWISILDPEILHLNPILQREFLFKQRDACSLDTSYLASMLVHESRDFTLQDCLTWLLTSQKDVDSLNTTTCLDVLSAMFNNPRLWQGRENKQTDESSNLQDNSLNSHQMRIDLNVNQLYRLIELMLHEFRQTMNDGASNESTTLNSLMEKRLALLLNLSAKETQRLRKAVNLMKQRKKFPAHVETCFMKYLYMRKPTLLPNMAAELGLNESNMLPNENKTEMDELIHRLILKIAEPAGTPEWEMKFKNVSTINKRLAITHPFAFIRQLPFMLSMLKGKSRLSHGAFKLTNQLMLCSHVFGLFDLLRPYVFQQDMASKNMMSLFVEVFLNLIQSSCLMPDECTVFVGKLVEFLNHYIASGNNDVGNVLSKHEMFFRDLLYDFPNFQGLTSICSLISTLHSSPEVKPTLVALTAAPWNEIQLTSFKRRLSMDHHDKDLLSVLRDLDETSKRSTDILQHFMEELCLLTSSSHQEIRNKSHMLLIRHCKQQPKKSARLIELYLERLNSNNTDVMMSAAAHVPQALLLCDEKCDVLLKRMYRIAIHSTNTEMTSHIQNVIRNMNIDYS